MSKQEPQPKQAYLVLDTNVFVQCKSLNELRWQTVCPDAAEIILLLTRVVTGELDKLKTDVSRRRADRARKVGQFIDQILDSAANEKVIRETSPRVVLRVAKRVRIDWKTYPGLDREHRDDQMVAEALTLRESGLEIILVSDDSGPRISAIQEGLATFKVRKDWLLPREPDRHEKEKQKLQVEVDLLREQRAQLGLEFATLEGDPLKELELSLAIVPAFTDAELDALVTETRARFPMAVFGQQSGKPKSKKGGSGGGIDMSQLEGLLQSGPSPSRIERYQNEEYPKFLEEVRSYFRRLPSYLTYQSIQVPVAIWLDNEGSVPAENLIMDIEAVGDVLLYEKPFGAEPPEFPEPPQQPKGSDLSSILPRFGGPSAGDFSIPYIESLRRREERDPTEFYWKTKLERTENTSCCLTCEDFRHGTNDVTSLVVVAPQECSSFKGAVKISVSATNLPKPLRKTVPVTIAETEIEIDILEAAREQELPETVIMIIEAVRGR